VPRLIVVNKKDEEIGSESRLRCHRGKGILHRAFTIFIFNREKGLLVQRRSKGKLLWPLFWETSCSSHPYKGDDVIKAAERRLKEELGFTCRLKFLDKFYYKAFYGDIGVEKEICYLLIGWFDGKIQPNKKEVAEIRWLSLLDLKKEIKKRPQEYVPWLKVVLKRLKSKTIQNYEDSA